MQRKLLPVIVLAVIAVFLSLAGCSESPAAQPAASPQSPAAEESPPAEITPSPVPEITEPAPGQEAGEEDDLGICHGRITEDVYVNPFLGMQFPLPEGWLFFTDRDLMRENSMPVPITEKTLLKTLKKNGVFLDMFATSPDGMSPLGIYAEVQYEKISPWAEGSGDDAALFSTARIRAKRIFALYGITDQKVSISRGELAGESCCYADILTYAGDACFYQRTFAVPRDEYIVLVTAIAMDQQRTIDLLNSFSPIEPES